MTKGVADEKNCPLAMDGFGCVGADQQRGMCAQAGVVLPISSCPDRFGPDAFSDSVGGSGLRIAIASGSAPGLGYAARSRALRRGDDGCDSHTDHVAADVLSQQLLLLTSLILGMP